jgi:cytochrome bd-type quinol oxidase subunit 2
LTVWERPGVWYIVALAGLVVFCGAVVTGQFSVLYSPLVLVVALGAFALGVHLSRRKARR